jgi:hypothetical protein
LEVCLVPTGEEQVQRPHSANGPFELVERDIMGGSQAGRSVQAQHDTDEFGHNRYEEDEASASITSTSMNGKKVLTIAIVA